MSSCVVACIAALVLMTATTASAQTREFMLRGFGDVGATTFTAEQSFDAILGSAERHGVRRRRRGRAAAAASSSNVRASRFRETGQRVFLFEGEQFDLGIPDDDHRDAGRGDRRLPVPVLRAASSRTAAPASGWYRFKETSQFATDERERGRPVHRLPRPRRRRGSAWRAGSALARRAAMGDRARCASATIRTACLTSSTNRTLAARRSASRSSSGCRDRDRAT